MSRLPAPRRRPTRGAGPVPGLPGLLVALVLVATAAACRPPPFSPPPHTPLEAPDPDSVEAVLFLVGDAGEALVERSPLVHHLRAAVEQWSRRLPADSSVAVVFLGDNIYPWGLRDRGEDGFSSDSARLAAQVWTVSGPEARADGVPGIFLAGNHDWGGESGPEGLTRLRNQERFLEEASRDGGPAVALVPPAGASGPELLELGAAARLVLVDTEWWIRTEDPEARARMLAGLEEGVAGGGGRPTVVASHHPLMSGGPHAERGLLDPMGILARAGAVVQDMSAEPYRELIEGATRVFGRTGPPLVWAAGHDHVLQVLEGVQEGQPRWTLVSGAASKVSHVTRVPGLVWADEAPGYMRLVFRAGGRVDVFVERAPRAYLECEGHEPERTRCLEEGVAAFETAFSARLR